MEISYQPVLNFQTGRLVKCEAFCRPREAGIDLGAFVAAAEMHGSLREFTDRVFDNVFADWRRHGSPDLDLSVNLSVADVAESDIVRRVERACKKHRFDPKGLWFEIDDRVQSMFEKDSLANLTSLASLGIRFSIDSFGHELAQTTCLELQNMGASEVKIDGRYVRDADENMNHRNLITTVVGMARDLRIVTVAKSIERENIAALMVRLGVSHGQGYYFARPTSASAIVALVERMANASAFPSGR